MGLYEPSTGIFTTASAGEPLSMRLTFIWNGGRTRSIPMPTGPKCSIGVRASASFGYVLKSGCSL